MYSGILLLDERSPFFQFTNDLKNCPISPINDFITQNNIDIAILNPHQLTYYYTRPFALYFDLKDSRKASPYLYDFLIIDIHQAFLKFTDIYPEYWDEIQTSFHTIHYIH